MLRSLALALFIFGTIPFIFKRPFIGLLMWSWLGYMNPYRLTYGFAYSFPWVLIIATVTLLSFAISRERKRVPMSATTVLLFAFLIWTGFTTLFAVEPAAAQEKFTEFLKVMIMVIVTLMLVNDRQRMHWLAWMVVISLGFYGIKGGLFTVMKGGVNHVLGPPGSFISDNNALALALSMTIPFMRYLQLHSARKLIRVGLGAAMLLTGIAVLGTYSRGGLISLVIVAAALLVKGRRRIVVLTVAIVIGATAYHFMPPEWTARMDTLHDARQTDSGETRIQSWEFAANVAVHRPLVGGGFDVYQSAAMWENYGPEGAIPRAIHSIYFRTLGEQGFIGLGLLLALLATSWRNCSKVRKRTRDDLQSRWAFDLASMLQVSLVAFMTAGAFLPMPYFDLVYQLMALSVALSDHVARTANERLTKNVGRAALASPEPYATPSGGRRVRHA